MRKILVLLSMFSSYAMADNPKIVLVDQFQSNDRTKTWTPPVNSPDVMVGAKDTRTTLTFRVDPVLGSSSGDGSLARPYQTVAQAEAACATAGASESNYCAIRLSAGSHHLGPSDVLKPHIFYEGANGDGLTFLFSPDGAGGYLPIDADFGSDGGFIGIRDIALYDLSSFNGGDLQVHSHAGNLSGFNQIELHHSILQNGFSWTGLGTSSDSALIQNSSQINGAITVGGIVFDTENSDVSGAITVSDTIGNTLYRNFNGAYGSITATGSTHSSTVILGSTKYLNGNITMTGTHAALNSDDGSLPPLSANVILSGGAVLNRKSNAYSLGNDSTVSGASVKDALNNVLPLAGGTLSGVLDLGTHQIHNVSDPSSAQDAATKNYVDTASSGANKFLSNLSSPTNVSQDLHLAGHSIDQLVSLTGNGVTADLGINGEWNFSLSTTQFEPAPSTPSLLINMAAVTPNNGSVVFGIQDFATDIAPADLYVQTGAQTTVGSTNSTGELFLYSGPITDTGASGNTGATVLFTGDNSGSGGSGGLFLNSGNTQSGASGPVVIQSGGVAVGPSSNSGTVFITTGGINAGVGASGSITLQTGDSNAGGNSGDITFQTGVASVTRGTVHFNAKAVDAGSVLINNVTDPSSAQDAATKNYVDTNFIKTTSAAGFFLPLSSGPLTSIVTNEIIGTGKAVRATTVENIEASAVGFTCLTNPTLTLLDCGASAGACTSGTTALGSVTLTGANSITDGTVSVSSIAAGHYWAWQITAGSCTALNVIGSAEGKMQ